MWSTRYSAPAGASSVRRTSYGGTAKRASARAAAGKQRRSAKIAAYREAAVLANLATRGLQLAKGELKAVDTFCSAGSMASVAVPDYTGAPIIKLLNGIARGDDINERNGRQVIMKSVQINMVFRPSSTQANQLPTVVRMMLVYDKQTNATAPTIANILAPPGSEPWNCAALRNLEYRDRFIVLKDDFIPIASATATALQMPYTPHKVFLPINLPVTFNAGDNGTVADIATGSLYLIMLSHLAAANAPEVSYHARVRYADP